MEFNYVHAKSFVSDDDLLKIANKAELARRQLLEKNGLGNEYTGWVDWATSIASEELQRIDSLAKQIRSKYDCLVVIGIGGSYLGAKALLEALKKDDEFEIVFIGNTLSSDYTTSVLNYLQNKNFAVNLISKSGTTTEPAIAFRLVVEAMKQRFANYKERIITTNSNKGMLHDEAVKEGYTEFIIPDSIGGRYSVLTAVGLLPLACANIDIHSLLNGSRDAFLDFASAPFAENAALKYASFRNILYNQGKSIELYVSYQPSLRYFGEWLKQLYGESEGKNYKGLFPAYATYSTDLHSLGQFVQDGPRIMFETIIAINKPKNDIVLKASKDNGDGLNYLAGKSLEYINKQAMQGTINAHVSGGVPNLIVGIDECTEYNFGYLVYFFMFACGISGYLLDVNPFNQEGVEEYKKNMFVLLEKPNVK